MKYAYSPIHHECATRVNYLIVDKKESMINHAYLKVKGVKYQLIKDEIAKSTGCNRSLFHTHLLFVLLQFHTVTLNINFEVCNME